MFGEDGDGDKVGEGATELRQYSLPKHEVIILCYSNQTIDSPSRTSYSKAP